MTDDTPTTRATSPGYKSGRATRPAHHTRLFLLRRRKSFASHQDAVEEFLALVVGVDPVAPEQEVVDFVGIDDLLEGHALGFETLGEIDGLAELNVAVVVALDQEHGRAPG